LSYGLLGVESLPFPGCRKSKHYASARLFAALNVQWIEQTSGERTHTVSSVPTGATPSASELRLLKALVELRQHAQYRERQLGDTIAIEVFHLREEGVSVRRLASGLGVSPTTVHGWTQRGRQLARQKP